MDYHALIAKDYEALRAQLNKPSAHRNVTHEVVFEIARRKPKQLVLYATLEDVPTVKKIEFGWSLGGPQWRGSRKSKWPLLEDHCATFLNSTWTSGVDLRTPAEELGRTLKVIVRLSQRPM